MSRQRRVPKAIDSEGLLERMRPAHGALVEILRAYPARHPIYREATVTLADLDALATLLTGREGYFAPPRHG